MEQIEDMACRDHKDKKYKYICQAEQCRYDPLVCEMCLEQFHKGHQYKTLDKAKEENVQFKEKEFSAYLTISQIAEKKLTDCQKSLTEIKSIFQDLFEPACNGNVSIICADFNLFCQYGGAPQQNHFSKEQADNLIYQLSELFKPIEKLAKWSSNFRTKCNDYKKYREYMYKAQNQFRLGFEDYDTILQQAQKISLNCNKVSHYMEGKSAMEAILTNLTSNILSFEVQNSNQKHLDQALLKFTKASQDSGFIQARIMKGQTEYKLMEFDKAIETFKGIINQSQKETYLTAYLKLVRACRKRKRFDEAHQFLRKVFQLIESKQEFDLKSEGKIKTLIEKLLKQFEKTIKGFRGQNAIEAQVEFKGFLKHCHFNILIDNEWCSIRYDL